MNPQDLAPSANYLQQSEVVLVVLPDQPTFDQQLAAASLNLSLIDMGKSSQLLGVKELANPTIAGLDYLKTEIGANNLVIGFDYDAHAVDNVSYHLDEEANKFYLTIKPQKGHNPLNKNSIQVDYAGADADLIILFGIKNLEELSQLYLGYEELYQSANIIAIGDRNPSFQSNYLSVLGFSSYCEMIFRLLEQARLTPTTEVATNLLAGIQYQTNNYVDLKADANTFEAVAALLRLGARRKAGAFGSSLKKNNEAEGVKARTTTSVQSPTESGEDDSSTKITESTDVFSQSEDKPHSNKLREKKTAETKPKKEEASQSPPPMRPSGLMK